MFGKKSDKGKRIVPAYVFNETEKHLISNKYTYELETLIVGGKKVNCVVFNEDAFDIIDDLETHYILEAKNDNAEMRGFSVRLSTVCFQMIRELGYINGANLIEVGKSLKVIGRCIALACVVGLANIDLQIARRLLPLVRAI